MIILGRMVSIFYLLFQFSIVEAETIGKLWQELGGTDLSLFRNITIIKSSNDSFSDYKDNLEKYNLLEKATFSKSKDHSSKDHSLRMIYYSIRATKELSDENSWYSLKSQAHPATRDNWFMNTYLFAHVMYGHLLSRYHGENKYMDSERAVWRVSDASRTNVQFMMSFICQISAMFREVLNSDIENIKQIGVTKKGSVYTITIPMDSRTAALSNIYIPGKTEKTTSTSADIFSKSISGLSITVDEDDKKAQNIAIVPIERTLLMYRYLKEDLKTLFMLALNKLDIVKQAVESQVEPIKEINTLLANVTCANQTSKTGKKYEPEQENFEIKKAFLDEACNNMKLISQKYRDTLEENTKQILLEIKKMIVEIRRTVEYFMTIENVIENKDSTPFKSSSLVVSSMWPSIPGEGGERLPKSQKMAAKELIEHLSKEEESGESDSESSSGSLEEKWTKPSSTAELSVEAQQVIAYISKINYYTEKEVIILQLKKIAMGKGEEKKEKEPNEKQEQISEETAPTFVQWFVQKKCFSLLQHPAFAEAFGYLWGSFDVTELKEEKSVLEKNINNQLTLMRSSSEALVQLARKIGIEVVPDFF